MRRLIYAPKVYIFVRSSNLDGKIFDVSSDVVRGTVTQNCGDVSKATFYLKNRYQKWIRDPKAKYKQIFLPMDLCTIWLQRIAGKPIQVFTGYLDSVPYYQGLAGDAMFEATCTLKKLAYTWFDPGLPFFTQWVNSQDGWQYNVTTGTAIRPVSQRGQVVGTDTLPGDASNNQASINDGGFADLLGRFMTEVAGWDPDDVLIGALPPNIPKIAARLFTDIENDAKTDLENFSTFMGQVLGVNGWAGSSNQITAGGTTVQANPAIQLAKTISDEASIASVPPLVAVFAAEMLSGLNPQKDKLQGNARGNEWGFGLYSFHPQVAAGDLGIQASTPEGAKVGPTIEGFLVTELLDPKNATQAFCKLLNKKQGDFAIRAKNNDLTAMVKWIEAGIGYSIPDSVDQTTALKTAKQLVASSYVVAPNATPSVEIDPSAVTWNDPAIQKLLTNQSEKLAFKSYTSAKPWLAAVLARAKSISPNLRLAAKKDSRDTEVVITGSAGDMKSFYNSFKGKAGVEFDAVQIKSGATYKTLLQGTESTRTDATIPIGINSVVVVQSTAPTSSTVEINATTGGSTTTAAVAAADPSAQGGASFTQFAAFSANSAFSANFVFGDASFNLAKFNTGERALMNDTSCLDAAKQLCQASLRDFRSLPDGRFMAFYPDYFGATRKPYWSIKNIEIIDFGIQLNDEALATHVYVVGDTGNPNGSIDELDQLSTRGVATINMAFMLSSFIEGYDGTAEDTTLGRLTDAVSFLQHYGARKHVEDQPLITNTYYEFLMAWQRFMQLWASQFATEATFTFQPEVMAGGLLEFPDHGIQMYCDSVTHSWDYTSGFTTQAVLSSPSIINGQAVRERTSLPGFALGGNANTVGLGAGGD